MERISILLLLLSLWACEPSGDGGSSSSDLGSSPTIRLSDVIVTESDPDQGGLSHPVVQIAYQLSIASESQISFQWSTGNTTARSGRDYRSVVGSTEIIAPGVRSGVLEVTLISDILHEDDERFTVNVLENSLSEIQARGSDTTAFVTIEDDDPMPSLSFSDIIVSEDASSASMRYTLSAPSGKEISFSWSTRDRGASAGSDYTGVSNREAMLLPENIGGFLDVEIINDLDYEPGESIEIVIDSSALTGASLASSDSAPTVTILDNDFPTITLSQASLEVNEGVGHAVILYSITPANVYHDVSFRWSTQSSTAFSGSDYGRVDITHTVLAGENSIGELRVPIIDDSANEQREDFSVNINVDSLMGVRTEDTSPSTAVTIIDDDAIPNIQIADVIVEESQAQAEVVYLLSSPSGRDVSFQWFTQDGTAVAGAGGDYTAILSGTTYTIPAGVVRGTIAVTLNDDTVTEVSGGEDFKVIIDESTLDGIVSAGSNLQATVTILDRPFLRVEDIQIDENDGSVRVSYYLSSISGQDVTFDWATRDGSAIGGSDFTTVASTSVTIPTGQIKGDLVVTITDDVTFEGRETFEVVLSSLMGVESSDNDLIAEVTIADDEDIVCPAGYVKVGALAGYTEAAFCVAKYEMKEDGSGSAISTSQGAPWVNIDRIDAQAECAAIGAGYDLINNEQWQAMVRNIEAVGSNWDGGRIGSVGGLNRGHSDSFPAYPLPAHSNDHQGCHATGQQCGLSSWSTQKRTHVLLGGEVVWDVAGNAWEWIKDDNTLSYGPNNYISLVTVGSHPILNSLSEGSGASRSAKDQFGPLGGYGYHNSNNFAGLGHGMLEVSFTVDELSGGLDQSHKGILRGGGLSDHNKSGVFAVSLREEIGNTTVGVNGFRCVLVLIP